jgi:hypothetical protein
MYNGIYKYEEVSHPKETNNIFHIRKMLIWLPMEPWTSSAELLSSR